ncbi:hypothetical protein Ancab_016142 [Ancistrocladus abbreviatus]
MNSAARVYMSGIKQMPIRELKSRSTPAAVVRAGSQSDGDASDVLHLFLYVRFSILLFVEFLRGGGERVRLIKTVKFWDLETFELIGTAGPEVLIHFLNSWSWGLTEFFLTVVLWSTLYDLNPDGKTLLCGLHESLRVFSWEPIQCHDTVDVGWSRLSDLNVHEGKLLACSYNQSCVGVWVVDIAQIEPYAVCSHLNGLSESKSTSSGNGSVLTENIARAGLGRLSTAQNSDLVEKGTTGSVPGTPPRVSLSTSPKNNATSTVISSTTAQKRNSTRTQLVNNFPIYSKSDITPVIVPRNDVRLEQASETKKEVFTRRTIPFVSQSKSSDFRRLSNAGVESEGPAISIMPESVTVKAVEASGTATGSILPAVRNLNIGITGGERMLKDDRCIGSVKVENNSALEPCAGYQREGENRVHRTNKDAGSVEVQRPGRTRSLVVNWEKRERSSDDEGPTSSNASAATAGVHLRSMNMKSKQQGYFSPVEKELCSASDDDTIADIMERHDQFVGSMQARLTKLQIVHRYWERNDIKGAIDAMGKMCDHGVLADVISFLTENADIITLEICGGLLPLLAMLLESDMDRHLGISLDLLIKLVRVFGSLIYSALSAPSSVGVDIEAEQRLERCNLCYIELERVKRCLPSLTRGGSVAKSAQELNLALNAVSE